MKHPNNGPTISSTVTIRSSDADAKSDYEWLASQSDDRKARKARRYAARLKKREEKRKLQSYWQNRSRTKGCWLRVLLDARILPGS